VTRRSRSNVRSPWIVHFDSGSCNGCDIEIFATLTPRYDIERFGALNKGNPKHADVLVITGPVTHKTKERLLNLYAQIPEPKLVMAVGNCASSGKPFWPEAYNTLGGVDKVIPVDVYVPGCAARPEAIIDGLVLCLAKLQGVLEGRTVGAPKEGGAHDRVVEVTMEAPAGRKGRKAVKERSGRASPASGDGGAKAVPALDGDAKPRPEQAEVGDTRPSKGGG
jgi:ech hydrogenase subunit C